MEAAEIDAAVSAIREATVLCRQFFLQRDHLKALQKTNGSPVTLADYAIQAIICKHLHEELGDISIVAEEDVAILERDASLLDSVVHLVALRWPDATSGSVLGALAGLHDRVTGSAYWALDPIDGTRGFLEGRHHTISLAKIVDGRPVFGALGCPMLSPEATIPTFDAGGVILFTRAGGAWQRRLDGSEADRPLHIETAVPGPCVVTHSLRADYSNIGEVHRVMESLGKKWRSIPADSQIKYGLVARGDAHIYMRIPSHPERAEAVWDHAPGVAIAEAAGALVTDLQGKPLDFADPAGLTTNYGILCTHPNLHAELRTQLATLGLDHPP